MPFNIIVIILRVYAMNEEKKITIVNKNAYKCLVDVYVEL